MLSKTRKVLQNCICKCKEEEGRRGWKDRKGWRGLEKRKDGGKDLCRRSTLSCSLSRLIIGYDTTLARRGCRRGAGVWDKTPLQGPKTPPPPPPHDDRVRDVVSSLCELFLFNFKGNPTKVFSPALARFIVIQGIVCFMNFESFLSSLQGVTYRVLKD